MSSCGKRLPADFVFSFADTKILALGVVQSYCFESPDPLEFGSRSELGELRLEGER